MSPLFQTVSLHRVLPMTYVGKSIIFKTEKTTIPQTQIEEIIATYQPKTQADSIRLVRDVCFLPGTDNYGYVEQD